MKDVASVRERGVGDEAVGQETGQGDLIFGTRSSTIATLAERTSRFVLLVHLPGSHTADVVADALAEAIATLPEQLRRSLTWDQGKQMAEHARFSVATGVPVYFCDPPTAPGSGAATRTPTGCCASTSPAAPTSGRSRRVISTNVAAELNDRPRQTLGWKSPCQALDQALR